MLYLLILYRKAELYGHGSYSYWNCCCRPLFDLCFARSEDELAFLLEFLVVHERSERFELGPFLLYDRNMIYLLYGQEVERARVKAHELVDSLLKKKPDASFFKLDLENWQEAAFDEYVGGQGLFVQKYIVFFDMLFQNKEVKEYIVDRIKVLKESDNIFIILESTLDKATLTKFEKNSQKVQEFGSNEKVAKKKDEFNMFSMTDALGSRNRGKLWTLYQKAVRSDAVAEEIHGMLFWQIKSMILAEVSKDAKEAGLNPFVYSKAKGYAKNFKQEELKNISSTLVQMYHNAHKGIVNFDNELEKFLLEI